MLRPSLVVYFIGAFLLGPFLLSGSLGAQAISIAPERASGLYQTGETIRWQVTVTEPAKLTSPTYTIKSGGWTQISSGSLILNDGKATLETTLNQPGWVLLEVDGTSATSTKLQAYGGAVVDGEKITQATARPDDFDSFWNSKLAELAAVPVNPVLTSGASGRAGVDYATVMLDCIGGTHVQGQLALPSGGSSLPALLIVQWAGVYGLNKGWATDRAAEGWLVLNIQAHDITPIESDAYYQTLNTGALNNYPHIGNEDRETSYFLRMYLACHRAAEYLTTRPDWNGRTLVVMGASQGGLQTIVTAGLHPKVTAALAEVPAGCDQGGFDVGRLPGWPVWAWQTWDRTYAKVMDTARYFDTTNFAPRIHCPVLIGVGLIDTVVPPPGVYATYNLLRGARQIVPMPLADHGNNHTPYYGPQYAWLTDARTARLPSIRVAPQAVAAKLGEAASFSVVAADGQAYGYQWLKNGVVIPNANQDTFSIAQVAPSDQADYSVVVTSPGGSVTSTAATLNVPWCRLANVSVRSVSRSQTSPLIMGFVTTGGTKSLLMRAWGPALASFNVAGTLSDPVLALHDDIATGGSVLAQNDDWGTVGVTTIQSDVSRLGAYAFTDTNSKDSALRYDVNGLRTVYAYDKNNGTGVTLLELYDTDDSQASRLTNLSARNYVGSGDDILVAGFSIKGNKSMTVLIRGIGPTLAMAPFNLTGMLEDPVIKLYKIEQSVSTQIDGNDDWASGGVTALRTAFQATGAFDLPDVNSKDAASVVTLQPGLYTVELRSKTGVAGDAMIEVYEIP